MALFKNIVNRDVKDYNTPYNAGKAYYEWYNTARDDRKDTSVERVNLEYFTPGKLYHFRYTPIHKETLPWYDKYPLILSLGQKHYTNVILETGINLNLLPYDVKIFFLDKVYNDNKSLILEEISHRNLGQAKRQRSLNITYESLGSIVDSLYLRFAVRTYYKIKMRASYVISYENWTRMILINEYFFSKIVPEKVYSEYYQYIKHKNKK